jgi:TAT-translocated FGD2 family F420-dependent dehydrogenase
MAQIGFVLSHEQFPAPQLLEFGAAAERAGFDMLWTSDHFHPWQDNEGHAGQAWVTLAALGQRTTIPFGTGVTCPSFRYRPPIVAQAFASLGVLYPGRVFLGVGSGEALNELPASGEWGDYDERAARLVESVELIRKLFTGEWVTHEGRYYTVREARLYDIPPQPVPIYIAAEGPRAMRLAGTHGDGLISDSKTATTPEMRADFEAGAREAGKDPATMPILAEHFVYVGTRQEAEGVANRWRFLPNAWTEFVHDPDPRSIMRRAEQEVPLEKVMEMWTISEDPEEHVQALQKVIDGGVTHLFVHAGNDDQHAAIRFYGERVLPRLKGSAGQQAA